MHGVEKDPVEGAGLRKWRVQDFVPISFAIWPVGNMKGADRGMSSIEAAKLRFGRQTKMSEGGGVAIEEGSSRPRSSGV